MSSAGPLQRAALAPPRRRETCVVALLGNPHTGKSSLFTALTGTRQKTANYPGVTVEAKLGVTRLEDTELTVIDLPGTYSLDAHSPDERVAIEALLGRRAQTPRPDGVIIVTDASSLDRNLYLATQVLEFGLPTVIALTMVDVARARGIRIDIDQLSRAVGVPVLEVNSPRRQGLENLKRALRSELGGDHPALALGYPEEFARGLDVVHGKLAELAPRLGYEPTRPEALRLMVEGNGPLHAEIEAAGGAAALHEVDRLRSLVCGATSPALIEAQVRYSAIAGWLRQCRTRPRAEQHTLTDRVDAVLTHKLWGTLLFVAVMTLVFQGIYTWAQPLMELIEGATHGFGNWVGTHLEEGPLRGLIVQGLIGGVGSVLVFLPQILILFLFIALLEDVGYLTRAAFLMDRLMSRFGLNGKSFIPLLSSFACAVPGIMGTRVIEDRSTRFTTILLAPFMSCSARLPVYTLMIGAFVPQQKIAGVLSLQAVVLLAMYSVGIVFAIPTAWIVRRGIFKGKVAPFLLELPGYRIPQPRAILLTLAERAGAFLRRAGTIILAVSVVIWAASYFPRVEPGDAYGARRSAAAAEFVARTDNIARAYGATFPEDSLPRQEGFATALERFKQIDAGSPLDRLHLDISWHRNYRPPPEARSEASDLLRAGGLAQLDEAVNSALFTAVQDYARAERARDEKWAELDNEEAGERLRSSFLGRIGRSIEPVVMPLGWDWRIGMAAVASFPAREVIIATLGTIFNVGQADEQSEPLRVVLQNAKRPDGTRLFSLATGLSIMVFVALCCQCAATLAVIRRETNSWVWPLATFSYMTVLAYLGALVTFQIARALGA